MEDTNLIFTRYKFRASGIAHILTSLPTPITPEQLAELKVFLQEKRTGLNSNGRKTKWTDTKQKSVDSLFKKKRGIDELPKGCITHLANIFRSEFWKRRDDVNNKYVLKGNIVEEDSLQLMSDFDGAFYKKNDEYFDNEFAKGCPDNIDETTVREAKSKWNLKTFDESELIDEWKWQVKCYLWMTGREIGVLYCLLVNSPLSMINNEITRAFYAAGCPPDEDDKWFDMKCQIERNHIFDIDAFRDENPHYQFINPILDFDIPKKMRVIKYDIGLTEQDKFDMASRVIMCRQWLVNKEIETLEKLKSIQ